MPPPVVCPQCREELDIPAELRGRPVRCSACNGVFTPPVADDVPVVPPRRPADRDPARDDDRDDPVDRGGRDDGREFSRRPGSRRPPPPPARRGSFLWLWMLLAGTGGVCCLGCGGLLRFGMRVADPNLVPYTSEDGRFRAAFPGKPTVGTRADGDRPTTTVEWKRMLMGQAFETYFIHTTDLKRPLRKAAADKEAKIAADAVVNRPGFRETKRAAVDYAGGSGYEVHAAGEGDEVTMARVIVAGDRLYVVGVRGHGLDPNDAMRVEKFWDGFQLTDAPKAGKAAPPPADPAPDADEKPEKE